MIAVLSQGSPIQVNCATDTGYSSANFILEAVILDAFNSFQHVH